LHVQLTWSVRCDDDEVAKFFLDGLETQRLLPCVSYMKLYSERATISSRSAYRNYGRLHGTLEKRVRAVVERFSPRGLKPDSIRMPVRTRHPDPIPPGPFVFGAAIAGIKWVTLPQLEARELRVDGMSSGFIFKPDDSD